MSAPNDTGAAKRNSHGQLRAPDAATEDIRHLPFVISRTSNTDSGASSIAIHCRHNPTNHARPSTSGNGTPDRTPKSFYSVPTPTCRTHHTFRTATTFVTIEVHRTTPTNPSRSRKKK